MISPIYRTIVISIFLIPNFVLGQEVELTFSPNFSTIHDYGKNEKFDFGYNVFLDYNFLEFSNYQLSATLGYQNLNSKGNVSGENPNEFWYYEFEKDVDLLLIAAKLKRRINKVNLSLLTGLAINLNDRFDYTANEITKKPGDGELAAYYVPGYHKLNKTYHQIGFTLETFLVERNNFSLLVGYELHSNINAVLGKPEYLMMGLRIGIKI